MLHQDRPGGLNELLRRIDPGNTCNRCDVQHYQDASQVLQDCLHGHLPAPFLLSYSVFDFILSLYFVSGLCARLSWPSRQLLSAR